MSDHRRMRAAVAARNLLVMGTNAAGPGATLPDVAPEAAVPTPRHDPDVVRAFVAVLAVAVVPVAAFGDPAGPLPTVVLAVGGALFVVWARRPQLPPLLFAAVVLTCVLTVKATAGDLDGALFLVTLLVIAVAGWERSVPVLILVGAAALGTPLLIELLRPGDIDVPTWLLGIAMPGSSAGCSGGRRT